MMQQQMMMQNGQQPVMMQPGMQPGMMPQMPGPLGTQLNAGALIKKGAPGYMQGQGHTKNVVIEKNTQGCCFRAMIITGFITGGITWLVLLCCECPDLKGEDVWELDAPLVVQGAVAKQPLPEVGPPFEEARHQPAGELIISEAPPIIL